MRFLVFSQSKIFSKFIIDFFSDKEVVDLVFNQEMFFNKFYLYDYDLILLDFFQDKSCLNNLVKEVRDEKKNIPIICLLESSNYANLENFLTLQINYLIFSGYNEHSISLCEKLGSLTFDKKKDCFFVNDWPLKLCRREHILLKFLFLNQKKFSSKSELCQKVVEKSYSVDSKIIDVYIYRLRKIIKDKSLDIKIINHRNFGYKITACH